MNDLEARYQELQYPYKKRKACGTPEPLFDELVDLLRDYRQALAKANAALEKIAHPITWMQEDAKQQGYKLNGMMAVSIAANPDYLKGIARDALDNDAPKPEDSV